MKIITLTEEQFDNYVINHGNKVHIKVLVMDV